MAGTNASSLTPDMERLDTNIKGGVSCHPTTGLIHSTLVSFLLLVRRWAQKNN